MNNLMSFTKLAGMGKPNLVIKPAQPITPLTPPAGGGAAGAPGAAPFPAGPASLNPGGVDAVLAQQQQQEQAESAAAEQQSVVDQAQQDSEKATQAAEKAKSEAQRAVEKAQRETDTYRKSHEALQSKLHEMESQHNEIRGKHSEMEAAHSHEKQKVELLKMQLGIHQQQAKERESAQQASNNPTHLTEYAANIAKKVEGLGKHTKFAFVALTKAAQIGPTSTQPGATPGAPAASAAKPVTNTPAPVVAPPQAPATPAAPPQKTLWNRYKSGELGDAIVNSDPHAFRNIGTDTGTWAGRTAGKFTDFLAGGSRDFVRHGVMAGDEAGRGNYGTAAQHFGLGAADAGLALLPGGASAKGLSLLGRAGRVAVPVAANMGAHKFMSGSENPDPDTAAYRVGGQNDQEWNMEQELRATAGRLGATPQEQAANQAFRTDPTAAQTYQRTGLDPINEAVRAPIAGESNYKLHNPTANGLKDMAATMLAPAVNNNLFTGEPPPIWGNRMPQQQGGYDAVGRFQQLAPYFNTQNPFQE